MKAVEVERPKSTSPQDHLADPPDSTCPQVIHSRPEAIGNSWVPMTATKEGEEQDGEPSVHGSVCHLILTLVYVITSSVYLFDSDNANRQLFENALMGEDLEIGVPRIPNLELENPNEKALDMIADIDKEKLSDMNSKKDDEQLEKKQQDLIRDELNGDVRNQASDFMDVITDSNDSPMESTVFDIPNDLFKDSGKKEKAVHDNNELPSLGLSLKSLRDYGDTGTRLHEKNVLRHSDQHSAFTRYNSASTANQSAIGNVSSGSPLDNSSEAAKTESVQNLQSHTNGTLPSQRSNGSSNNSDMGLTTSSAFTKPMVFSDKPTPNSTVKCLHPSAFQRAQNGHTSLPQPVVQGKADTAMSSTNLVQVGGMNQQVQVQHHHHHYHHHHHHVHNIPQQQLANQDNLLLKNMAAAAAQCRSSNVLHVPFEGNTSNHNLNGSNQGSNEHKGSCIASTARGSNIESDNGLAMKGGDGDGIGYGSQSRVDKNRLELREAALNKFRQKRKERCFEKKVRYQSRKKLAEQRPRVRGQFVRQVAHENK